MRYKLSAPLKEGFRNYARGGLYIPRGGFLEVEVLPDLPAGQEENKALLKKRTESTNPAGCLVSDDGVIQIRQRALNAMMADGKMSVIQVSAPSGALATQNAELLSRLREAEHARKEAEARAAEAEAKHEHAVAALASERKSAADAEAALHMATEEGVGLLGEVERLRKELAEAKAKPAATKPAKADATHEGKKG